MVFLTQIGMGAVGGASPTALVVRLLAAMGHHLTVPNGSCSAVVVECQEVP